MEQIFLLSSANGGAGESIRLVSVDEQGWHLRQSIDRPQDASFLAADVRCIYSVTEANDRAAIHRLPIHFSPSSPMETVSLPEGRGLCHLALSEKNHLLLGGCYESGHLLAVDVQNPRMEPVCMEYQQDLRRRSGLQGRVHCFLPDPAEQYAFAVNIDYDQIDCFKLSPGAITPMPRGHSVLLPVGEGPRHLLFHPVLPVAYCVTEYSNRLHIFHYDPAQGLLTLAESRPLLQREPLVHSFGASIAMSRDKRFLYASVRGDNSITVFPLNEQGFPKGQISVSCGGNWPRHIALSRDSSLLAVCNQRSDTVTVFARNAQTGLPEEIVAQIPMKNPCFAENVINVF